MDFSCITEIVTANKNKHGKNKTVLEEVPKKMFLKNTIEKNRQNKELVKHWEIQDTFKTSCLINNYR